MNEKRILIRLHEARTTGLEGEGWRKHFRKYPSRQELEQAAAGLAPQPPGEGMTYGESLDNLGDWLREIGVRNGSPEAGWALDAFDKAAARSGWDPETGDPK